MNLPLEPHNMHAYLTGDMDPESQTEFEAWLAQDPQNQKEFNQFKSLWLQTEPTGVPPFQADKVWREIQRNCGLASTQSPGPSTRFFRWLSYGLPVLATALWALFVWSKPVTPIVIQSGPQEQRQVRLPDGTHVTLDSNSTLYYPKTFDKEERRVRLEGRGYFAVAHDANHPFRVQTEVATVTVLGTQFEVWTPKKETRVWVAEGRVKLKPHAADPLELTPNQQIACSADGFKSPIQTRDAQALVLWQKGQLVFERVPLIEVLQALESVFDQPIELAQDLPPDRTFTGQFERRNLANILQEICLSFQYELIKTSEGFLIQAPTMP